MTPKERPSCLLVCVRVCVCVCVGVSEDEWVGECSQHPFLLRKPNTQPNRVGSRRTEGLSTDDALGKRLSIRADA